MQARSNARLAAVQALYQMEASGDGVEAVILEFRTHRLGADPESGRPCAADDGFFADLLRGVVRLQEKIDPLINRHLSRNWTLARLDSTARAILRAAAFELIHRADVPALAVIDEYLDIAAGFFGDEDRRFINAVLDAMARDVRPDAFERPAGQARRP
jgi:N utilization substance protein B